MLERRTAHTDQQAPTKLTRIRELDGLPHGSVVMATSAPHPRYFRRVPGGWAACDAFGRTALQDVLARELPGWPPVLPSRDLRRPVALVALPDELPLEVRKHELEETLEGLDIVLEDGELDLLDKLELELGITVGWAA